MRLAAAAPLTAALLTTALLAGLPTPAIAGGVPADPAAGAIYASVTNRSGGAAEGFLRFERWDAWWDDFFAANLAASPWADRVDLEELARERRTEYFATHGLFERLAYTLHDQTPDLDRRLVCHYGQLARITQDPDSAFVETIDGRRLAVRRGSADLDGELIIATAGGDSTVMDMAAVTTIVFAAAPEGARPPWRRLRGTVSTTEGPLAGGIQWDMSENTSLDILDGDADGTSHDVPMGTIAALVREDNGTTVTLFDGGVLHLTGTNDVNDENRGIAVTDADGLRVTVPWRDFVRLDLEAEPDAGPAREAFAPGAALAGTVETTDGATLYGRLAYDLDESRGSDLLDGEQDGWDWTIPFAQVASIAPGETGCTVTLRDGRSLELGDGNDVDGRNAGVLVMGSQGDIRVPWSAIRSIRFDP